MITRRAVETETYEQVKGGILFKDLLLNPVSSTDSGSTGRFPKWLNEVLPPRIVTSVPYPCLFEEELKIKKEGKDNRLSPFNERSLGLVS